MLKPDSPELRLSLDSSSSPSRACSICSKSLNFRKKKTCKLCMNTVCSDHCQRVKTFNMFEEPQPICDLCYIEETKKEVLIELQNEIKSLEEDLKTAISINEKLERDHSEKVSQINELEAEVLKANSDLNKHSVSYSAELKEEQDKNKELKEITENKINSLDKIKAEENESFKIYQKAIEESESIRKQRDVLKETKDGLNTQIDKINFKLKGSLNAANISHFLCESCVDKVEEANKSRASVGTSLLEDSCLNVDDERESIMSSVREYKEILAHQTSKPGESSSCIVV